MQRYLSEVVWFPTAALSNYITWEKIDSLSARAIMNYKGSTGSGVFYFNSEGNFIKFSTMRYMGSGDEAVLKEWIITAKEYQIINGINIPVILDVTWKLDSGDFKWFALQVYDVEYNKAELWN